MKRRRDQRGFVLSAPIFVMVVVAALAVYAATQSGASHLTAAFSLRGSQAHFAARSAIEWAIGDIVNNAAAGLGCGGAPVTFSLPAGAGAGYATAITCTSQAVTEGAASYTVYSLTAVATRGNAGTPGYVSRTLIATVAR